MKFTKHEGIRGSWEWRTPIAKRQWSLAVFPPLDWIVQAQSHKNDPNGTWEARFAHHDYHTYEYSFGKGTFQGESNILKPMVHLNGIPCAMMFCTSLMEKMRTVEADIPVEVMEERWAEFLNYVQSRLDMFTVQTWGRG